MPPLNFIPPMPAAAAKKRGQGGWSVDDGNRSTTPLPSSQPAATELFQSVIERVSGILSAVHPPATVISGQQGGVKPVDTPNSPQGQAAASGAPSRKTGARKFGYGVWDLASMELSPDPRPGTTIPVSAPSEQLKQVIEHLSASGADLAARGLQRGFRCGAYRAEQASGIFSAVHPPATVNSGSPRAVMATDANHPAASSTPRGKAAASDASTRKTEAGKFASGVCGLASGELTPDPGPETPNSVSNLAPVLNVLISPANVALFTPDLAIATAPMIPAGKSGDISGYSPASQNTGPSSEAVVDFIGGESPTERKPASGATAEILNEKDSNPTNTSEPVQIIVPQKNSLDLPVAVSLLASGAPDSKPVPSMLQSSSADPEISAALPSLEQIGNAAPADAPCENAPEIREQLGVINVTNGSGCGPVPKLDAMKAADGTTVAQQDVTMKTAAKEKLFSGAKQKLPGAATVATGEKLPVRSEREVAPATIRIHVDPVIPSGAGISDNDGPDKSAAPEILDLPRIAPSLVAYFQRTQALVSLQVMRLQQTGADEMHVVIQPDAGLQLSLHLHQRGGGVELQAVLDRGNFGLLNRHWPELQQQLELRGVRVAPLANAEQPFGGGSEGFRQPTTSHGQHAEDDADLAEMPPVLIPGLPTATATASASTITSRRLETWA